MSFSPFYIFIIITAFFTFIWDILITMARIRTTVTIHVRLRIDNIHQKKKKIEN